MNVVGVSWGLKGMNVVGVSLGVKKGWMLLV
jgi:hypothetical protein